MASNYTSNYGLCQWAASDKVLRTEFNADNAKIDAAIASKASTAALNSLQTTVNGKASQSALDSLKTTVNGKASQSALNALKNTVTSQGTALELRNCCMVTGSYQGTGSSGSSAPNSLTFAHKPVFLYVSGDGSDCFTFAIRGQANAQCHALAKFQWLCFSWTGNSVSWYYNDTSSYSSDSYQMNTSSRTYHYFAILEL